MLVCTNYSNRISTSFFIDSEHKNPSDSQVTTYNKIIVALLYEGEIKNKTLKEIYIEGAK